MNFTAEAKTAMIQVNSTSMFPIKTFKPTNLTHSLVDILLKTRPA